MSNLRLIPRSPSIHFEDRTLYFSNIEGQWWIAIKPICEALGIDYLNQFKALKSDLTMGQLLSNQTMVASDGRARKMVCLPERYIYGWLFKISGRSKQFMAFQQKCYDVLYDYFHGTTATRKATIREVAMARREAARLRRDLAGDDRYIRLQELQGVLSSKSKELKMADRLLEEEQLLLFPEV
jgi:hypothetical protein